MSDQSKVITGRPGSTGLSARIWPPIVRRLPFVPSIVPSTILAMALSACVPQSSELTPRSEPAQLASRPEPRLCRPAAALLASPRAPDCVFRRPAAKAMDPDEFSRLKAEYELSCYQTAERAVRRRLRELQAASKCLIASTR